MKRLFKRSEKTGLGLPSPAKSQRPYPGFRKNLVYYVGEYSNNTGIHGFKYMGEPGRSTVEKLWWLVLFCISLYICINLIVQTWTKWDTSPVLVSFARSPTPVWQVPFPAVTICSESKSQQRKYNFTEAYTKYVLSLNEKSNMTEEEMKKFADISLICDNHLYNGGNQTTGFDTIEKLMNIAPQMDEIFYDCTWTMLGQDCSKMFTPMLTEDGLCFTFNMLDRSELMKNLVYFHGDYMLHDIASNGWSLENGYLKNAAMDTFPKRAISAGSSTGLHLILRNYQQDLDYICRGPVQGFRVLLHHPAEVPRVGMQYFRAPLNQEVVVSVKPDMMTTSEGLRSYDAHRRQCFFPQERQLYFYQSYTQQKCQVECLTNYTLAKCGCIAYHMPHEERTSICGSGSLRCMFDAQTELLQNELHGGLSHIDTEEEGNLTSNCDCLPACTSLVYNAETSQAEFEWKKWFEALENINSTNNISGLQLTKITIFFKEQQFITSERNELFGLTDFLANCGGILGLFTGFSFLSIVEILYFVSLRLICNVKKYGRHYWSGSPVLLNANIYSNRT